MTRWPNGPIASWFSALSSACCRSSALPTRSTSTFAYYGPHQERALGSRDALRRRGLKLRHRGGNALRPRLGVPNSLLGIAYYILLIVGAMGNWSFGINLYFPFHNVVVPFALGILILVSAGTTLLGFYLIYALRRKATRRLSSLLHCACDQCRTFYAIGHPRFLEFSYRS